jgi:hypothetical protein
VAYLRAGKVKKCLILIRLLLVYEIKCNLNTDLVFHIETIQIISFYYHLYNHLFFSFNFLLFSFSFSFLSEIEYAIIQKSSNKKNKNAEDTFGTAATLKW